MKGPETKVLVVVEASSHPFCFPKSVSSVPDSTVQSASDLARLGSIKKQGLLLRSETSLQGRQVGGSG